MPNGFIQSPEQCEVQSAGADGSDFKALNFIFLGQDILNVKQSLFSCRAHCGQAGGAHLSRCGFVHGGQWPTWHWTWATCPRVLC